MTDQTPNSEIAEILAVFDDIAYRPNSYDFDKAATQLQQLMIEAKIEELRGLPIFYEYVESGDDKLDSQATVYIRNRIKAYIAERERIAYEKGWKNAMEQSNTPEVI